MPPVQYDIATSPAAQGRELLDRVIASADLSRSPRLRQLFEYLYEKSMSDPGSPPSEERIGVDVFGRARGYDTGSDTIVRVQVSQLRKKLEHYFLSEGAAEPLVIVLPKRSYSLAVLPRKQVPVPKELEESGRGRGLRTLTIGLAAALALSLIPMAWLVQENGRLRVRASQGLGPTPYRDHFWSPFLATGRQSQIVTSDANVMALCDFLYRTLTPAEYIGSGYPAALIDAEVKDPSTRRVLKSISSNFVTNMPDLRVTSRLSPLAAALGGRMNVLFARDFRYQPQSSGNLILLSHRKANPWVSLFEERLNFQYEFNSTENRAAIVNRSPLAGEQARYPVEWGVQTYAVIAHLRKPVGEGSVLLLGGADTVAVEADSNLLTDEGRIRGLYTRLGITTAGPVPDFEVLLKARLLRGSVRDYEVVAHRVHSRTN
ncbi:MAG: winged helix-turn-helix domain-containing protein [Candidatus Solibacter usitatus]|nr:winged helix-turn-helix domain-containing protein [Candidatus Solibacter usitatus]